MKAVELLAGALDAQKAECRELVQEEGAEYRNYADKADDDLGVDEYGEDS